MQSPESRLINILKRKHVEYVATLPCEKIGGLLREVATEFFHIPLTREEEGVGISAGIALAGKRPAMFVQSSGIGNMINALLSLTGFYELPLAVFISQRGIYREKIAAQIPMGRHLAGILKGAGIACSMIRCPNDFRRVEEKLDDVYRRGWIHAFLMSPAVFEEACEIGEKPVPACPVAGRTKGFVSGAVRPRFTRFEILEILAPLLGRRAVVCNLGFPSKELFHIGHKPSHFYMLGSMGMATPIGIGISLASEREVVVIDGDGSLLMNPGSLATAAHFAPRNLSIIAIDNGSYGSTGDQPTLTGSCVDLGIVARGFGMRNVIRAASREQLTRALGRPRSGPVFIHVLAIPGNRDVPPIRLHHLEIKRGVMGFLKMRR